MKFKTQRDEEERLERAAKIQAHLKKTAKEVPTYPDDEPPNWSAEVPSQPAESKAEPQAAESLVSETRQPQAAPTRIYPPLRAWEKIGAFGRRFQYRPMTSREFELEQDRLFMASIQKQDEAHAKKVAAFKREEEAEQKATRKRAEQEARTGKRAYEPGRYCSVEEARRRGYLDGGTGEGSSGNEWSSPGNPDGLMGGGR